MGFSRSDNKGISSLTIMKKWAVLLLLASTLTAYSCSYKNLTAKKASARSELFLKYPDIITVTDSEKPHIVYFLLSESCKRKGDTDRALIYLLKAHDIDRSSLFLKKEIAKLHIQRNEISDALEIIDEGLKIDPDYIEFLGILVQIKLIQNKDDEAPPVLEKILASNPDDQTIYFLLGGLYSKLNNISKAVETFKRLTDRFENSYSGHYYLGRLNIIEEKFDLAEAEFKEAFRLNSELLEALYGLVHIYEVQNKDHELKITLESIIAKDPEDIRTILSLALILHQEQDSEKAMAMLEKLSKEEKNTQDILKTIDKRYIRKSEYEKALFLLEGLVNSAPVKGDYFYFMGVCYNRLENISHAITQFEKVSPESMFYEKAILIRAFHHMDGNEHQKAIRVLEKAHRLVPDNTEFIFFLGSFYEEVELYQKAVDMYVLGISIENENPQLHFRLAVTYDKKGDKQACIRELKNVIRIAPEDANALNYLGYTYADMGINLDEAEDLILQAMKYKPDDGYITDSLGWVHYKKGNFSKAVKLLKKAVSMVPDDPTLLEHLGDALVKTKNTEKAIEYYRRSIKLKKQDIHDIELKIEKLTNKQVVLTP